MTTAASSSAWPDIGLSPSVDRDLRFEPASQSQARILSAAEVRRFNEQGYLAPLDVFGAEAAERNRADFERLLAAVTAAGRDTYSINGFHTTCACLWDLAMTPAILDRVVDLLGPDVVCWGAHYFCKQPGDPKRVSWHQDAPYWPVAPARTVTAWIAIDNVDAGNGALRVVPGSHLHGTLPFRRSSEHEGNVLWLTVDGAEDLGRPTTLALHAGQISLHSDLLLHGSEPNPSTRRRCGLALRFASTAVRSWQGWNENAILCRGSDPSGHWKHHPRPQGDDVSSLKKVIGAN